MVKHRRYAELTKDRETFLTRELPEEAPLKRFTKVPKDQDPYNSKKQWKVAFFVSLLLAYMGGPAYINPFF